MVEGARTSSQCVESIHFLISQVGLSDFRTGWTGLVVGFLPEFIRARVIRDDILKFSELCDMGELLAGEMGLGSIEIAVFSISFSYRVKARNLEQLSERGGLGLRSLLDYARKSNQLLERDVDAIVGPIKTEVLNRDPSLEEPQFSRWVNTVKNAGLLIGSAFCMPEQQSEYLIRLTQKFAAEIDQSRFQSAYLDALEEIALEDFE